MSEVHDGHSRWTPETRLCVIFFGAALILNVTLSSIGWTNTLIGSHEFRQVQTAVTTHSFLAGGVKLDYETPLLGPPWEVPLEFPLFQACVTWFVRATGMDLDPAGKLVSWLFFISALPACYLLLDRFGVSPPRRLLFLALLLVSPLYIYFSRGFLIESTALSAACWFLVFFGRFLERPRIASFAGAALCGAAAGTIKVTTFAVFLMAALIMLGAALRNRAPKTFSWQLWLRAGGVVAGPILLTLWWVIRTSAIRHHNPDALFLDSHFGYWSFGDLALRFSPTFWIRTFRVWADAIVGEAGIALLVLYYCWLRGRYRWVVTGCVAAFLSGQLIFSNLYWVHDYYFYASGIFLVAALGFFVVEFIEQPAIPFVARWTFVAVVLGLQLSAYQRFYLDGQAENTTVPPFVELLTAISAPDEVVIVVGYDWDGWVPYYAGRHAFMVVNGHQFETASLRSDVERLQPDKVAAVVIQGALYRDRDFIHSTMGRLNLGVRPLFIDGARNVGIWVPDGRQALIRDQFVSRHFPGVEITPEENTSGRPITIYARQIQRRGEFAIFHPRPIRATALNDFTHSTVDEYSVVNANAPCEFVFHCPPGASHVVASYGLISEAYAHAGMTDGVEFVVSERQPDGTDTILFHRLLDPYATPADRGRQVLDLALPHPVTGELSFRTLPGPNNNASYDWSYWGEIRIE